MKSESYHWDWHRFWVGDITDAFLPEVALRMSIVYLVLIVCMRLLGKRMAAQLTRNERAAVTSLAAGVGLPVVAPDRGLLPAFIIVVIVVITTQAISMISARKVKFESLTQGDVSTIVANGMMNVKNMEGTGITRERVMGILRSREIHQLGLVKGLFFEANGNFTLIKNEKPTAGLCTIPDQDSEFIASFARVDQIVCHVCGNLSGNGTARPCTNCGHDQWTRAIN